MIETLIFGLKIILGTIGVFVIAFIVLVVVALFLEVCDRAIWFLRNKWNGTQYPFEGGEYWENVIVKKSEPKESEKNGTNNKML